VLTAIAMTRWENSLALFLRNRHAAGLILSRAASVSSIVSIVSIISISCGLY
jgi:hypothetical protein